MILFPTLWKHNNSYIQISPLSTKPNSLPDVLGTTYSMGRVQPMAPHMKRVPLWSYWCLEKGSLDFKVPVIAIPPSKDIPSMT